MIEYFAPPEVWKRLADKSIPKNGCGSKWTWWLVPDSLCCLGLDMTIPCAIHDEDYALGKTYEDKIVADRRFKNNGYRAVEAMPSCLRGMGYKLVDLYVSGVQGTLADIAYWRGKNKPEEMREAIVESAIKGVKIIKLTKGLT